MVVGGLCFVFGIASAFALTQPNSVVEGGFGPVGIVLVVIGALASVAGLFLLFSRRIGD
jgi:nitrate reductase gamma subunit